MNTDVAIATCISIFNTNDKKGTKITPPTPIEPIKKPARKKTIIENNKYKIGISNDLYPEKLSNNKYPHYLNIKSSTWKCFSVAPFPMFEAYTSLVLAA